MPEYLINQETYDKLRANLSSLEKDVLFLQEIKQILENATIVEAQEEGCLNIGDVVEISYDEFFAEPQKIRLVPVPTGKDDGIIEVSVNSEVGRQIVGKKIGEPIQLTNGMVITILSKVLDENQHKTR